MTATPTALKGSDTALTIEWSDGARQTIAWRLLRESCPCATCRVERQKPTADSGDDDDLLPVISPGEAGPVKATAMRPVGNYAYGIEFSDGHNTGIFPLDLLRQLGEESAAEDAG